MGNRLASATTTNDLEARPTETQKLWWPVIRKIYSILVIQLLLTVAVGAVVVSHDPIITFLTTTNGGLACYTMLIVTPFIMLCPLCYYRNCRRAKYVLFGFFTISLSSGIGLTCAFTNGKVILQVTILTAMVIVSLTLFTLWAAKRGYDFNFLGPFLFGAIMVTIIFAVIQMFFPLDGISVLMYGCLPATIFDQLERYGSQISLELATD